MESKYEIGFSWQGSEHKRIWEFGLGAAQKRNAQTHGQMFCQLQGRTQGGFGGSNPPPHWSVTKMHNKENITFLALLSLFFCNDTDFNMI